MDAVISALLAADDQAVAYSSQDMGSDAATLAHVNQKIIKFSALCLARTRSIRNRKITINCFPNELLVAVFRILSAVGPPTAWLRATHVCSHWRTLALSNPFLWTEIDCKLPEPLIELLLLRSRNAPLSLSCNNRYVVHLPVMQAMLKRNAQIGHLSVIYTDAIHLLRAFAPMMSNLKSLYLCHDIELTPSTPLSNSERPHNLHHLVARSYSWPLLPPFLRSLKTLELDDISGLPHMDALLDALGACPALEELSLRNCLPDLSQPDADGQVVALRTLRRLKIIEDSRTEVGTLCSHLSLPVTAEIYLAVQGSRMQELPNLNPYIFLEDRSLWPMLADAKHLAFRFHTKRIMLVLARDAMSYPFLRSALNINFYAADSLPEVLDLCLAPMVSPILETLDIHGVPTRTRPPDRTEYREAVERFPSDLWPRIFASFPNLKELTVHCVQDITALVDALEKPSGDLAVQAPALRELSVRCSLNAPARSALLRVLSYRDSRGARLETLVLIPPRGMEGSTLPDNFVDNLEKLVDDLSFFDEGYWKESDVEIFVDSGESTTAVVDAVETGAERTICGSSFAL